MIMDAHTHIHTHTHTGFICFVTIIGIPFSLQHLKLAQVLESGCMCLSVSVRVHARVFECVCVCVCVSLSFSLCVHMCSATRW